MSPLLKGRVLLLLVLALVAITGARVALAAALHVQLGWAPSAVSAFGGAPREASPTLTGGEPPTAPPTAPSATLTPLEPTPLPKALALPSPTKVSPLCARQPMNEQECLGLAEVWLPLAFAPLGQCGGQIIDGICHPRPDPCASLTTNGTCHPLLGQCESGTQQNSCDELQQILGDATRWMVTLAGAAGLLWILFSALSLSGLGRRAGQQDWKVLGERILVTCVVVFLLWRLGDLERAIELIIAAHNSDPATADGITALPIGTERDLWTLLISIILQGALIWFALRIALEALGSLIALGTSSRSTFGEHLLSLVEVTGLGLSTFYLPTFIGGVLGFFSHSS